MKAVIINFLKMRPGGLEPPAPGTGNLCSVQLSYGRLSRTKLIIRQIPSRFQAIGLKILFNV